MLYTLLIILVILKVKEEIIDEMNSIHASMLRRITSEIRR